MCSSGVVNNLRCPTTVGLILVGKNGVDNGGVKCESYCSPPSPLVGGLVSGGPFHTGGPPGAGLYSPERLGMGNNEVSVSENETAESEDDSSENLVNNMDTLLRLRGPGLLASPYLMPLPSGEVPFLCKSSLGGGGKIGGRR